MTAIQELESWIAKSSWCNEEYKRGLQDAMAILVARKERLGKAISMARKGIPNRASAENGRKRGAKSER